MESKEKVFLDYREKLLQLCKYYYKLFDMGWNEDKFYNFFLFLEANVEKVRDLNLDEKVKLFESSKERL